MNENATSKSCPQCGSPIPEDAPHGLCPKCVLGGVATPTSAGQPAGQAELPALEAVRAAFPQLEVLELIGQGGMGFVYRARQPNLDRLVALKLLWPKLGADPAFAERFNREARVLARLNHPNIVAVYDFGRSGDFYYLLMEFVDGVNLRQAMRAGRFSPGEALALVPRICDALQFAHEEGVLHRDIKPENLLLDAKGRLKIADFGIAKLVGQAKDNLTLTATGMAVGTPHYMAPEQLEHPEDVDQRADIYSLGVVFYEMLTGELPVGRFAPPSEKTAVDARVDLVVFRTLEREREKRYQNAGEVKTRVEDIRSSSAAAGSQATQAPGSAPPRLASTQTLEPPRQDIINPTPPLNERWSKKAIAAAAVDLLALIPALSSVILIPLGVARMGAQRPTPSVGIMLVGTIFAGVPALLGTLLGLSALKDIRNAAGQLRGRALALCAALYWPLFLVDVFLLALSVFLAGRILGSRGYGGGVIMALPTAWLGVAAIDWALASLAWHWSKGSSKSPRVTFAPAVVVCVLLALSLPTLFLGVTAFMPFAVARSSPALLPPTAVVATTDSASPAQVNAQFTLPAGQVAVFEIVTRDQGDILPLPMMAAYAISRADEPVTGTFRWAEQEHSEGVAGTAGRSCQIEITAAGSRSGIDGLGPPSALAGHYRGEISIQEKLEPDAEVVHWSGENDDSQSIGLRIRTQKTEPQLASPNSTTGLGTNWQAAFPSRPPATRP